MSPESIVPKLWKNGKEGDFTNLCERIKRTISPRQAAERYGLSVGRNGVTRCPFHDDGEKDERQQ